MQTTIDPATIKLADLEVIEAQQAKTLVVVESAPVRPLLTKRDAKQQIFGAMRMINHFSGAQMHREIDTVEFLSNRVDEVEKLLQEEREAFEAEKQGYQKQVKDMRQVLRSIALVMDGQVDPFELKPSSKWSKAELGQWIMAAVENMNWARQRVDNYIDPKNAVPIAPDPE